jgi:hypothetical protein
MMPPMSDFAPWMPVKVQRPKPCEFLPSDLVRQQNFNCSILMIT